MRSPSCRESDGRRGHRSSGYVMGTSRAYSRRALRAGERAAAARQSRPQRSSARRASAAAELSFVCGGCRMAARRFSCRSRCTASFTAVMRTLSASRTRTAAARAVRPSMNGTARSRRRAARWPRASMFWSAMARLEALLPSFDAARMRSRRTFWDCSRARWLCETARPRPRSARVQRIPTAMHYSM